MEFIADNKKKAGYDYIESKVKSDKFSFYSIHIILRMA